MGWPGLGLTCADTILPDEAGGAPGPAQTARGPGACPEGDPGMVGAPGEGGPGPQQRHQGTPVADSGPILFPLL